MLTNFTRNVKSNQGRKESTDQKCDNEDFQKPVDKKIYIEEVIPDADAASCFSDEVDVIFGCVFLPHICTTVLLRTGIGYKYSRYRTGLYVPVYTGIVPVRVLTHSPSIDT